MNRSRNIARVVLGSQKKRDGRLVIPYHLDKVLKTFGALISFTIDGFLMYKAQSFIFTPLLPIGIYLISNNGGIEIDPKRRQYRRYHQYFWRRTGEWKSLKSYRAVLYLPGQGSTSASGPDLSSNVKFKVVYYDIYLADESHREKLFIKTFSGEENAWEYAKWISQELDKPIEEYSPKVSKSTKKRRRKGKRKRK